MMSFLKALLGRKQSETVIHYTGHRILADPKQSRFPARREKDVRRAVDRVLKRENVIAGYGGLASGADLIVAEALLDRGAFLHVVLPCDVDRYVETSVEEAGERWVHRFYKALDHATKVTALECPATGVDFSAGTEEAMGQVKQVAEMGELAFLQLALFDGVMSGNPEGTSGDIERAKAAGWRQVILRVQKKGAIREL